MIVQINWRCKVKHTASAVEFWCKHRISHDPSATLYCAVGRKKHKISWCSTHQGVSTVDRIVVFFWLVPNHTKCHLFCTFNKKHKDHAMCDVCLYRCFKRKGVVCVRSVWKKITKIWNLSVYLLLFPLCALSLSTAVIINDRGKPLNMQLFNRTPTGERKKLSSHTVTFQYLCSRFLFASLRCVGCAYVEEK